MKNYLLILLAVFCITFSVGVPLAHAQIPIGVGPGNSPDTPIGGVAIFAAVGGGYALKKLYDQRDA